MPPGAKKRKALKKKQEAIGATTNNNKGFNGHGHDEHGSHDERDSDGNLSSPGSQGTRDSSPPPLSGLGEVTAKEKAEDVVTRGQGAKGEGGIAVGRGTDHEENGVDKPPNSLYENFTHNTRKAVSQEAGGTSVLESAPVIDSVKPVGSSVSKVVISDKNEKVESSTVLDSVQQKSDKNEEKRSPGSAAITRKEIKNVKESEVPECSEEKGEAKSANSGQLKEQSTKQGSWFIFITHPPVSRTKS